MPPYTSLCLSAAIITTITKSSVSLKSFFSLPFFISCVTLDKHPHLSEPLWGLQTPLQSCGELLFLCPGPLRLSTPVRRPQPAGWLPARPRSGPEQLPESAMARPPSQGPASKEFKQTRPGRNGTALRRKGLRLMLRGSGFMIIPVMVLLRRIREKAAGARRGGTNSPGPKASTANNVAPMVDKPKIGGGGCWGTGGKENPGSFQAFQGLSQTFPSERAFH